MYTLDYPWLLLIAPLPLVVYFFAKPHEEAKAALRSPWFERLARFAGRDPEKGIALKQSSLMERIMMAAVWLLIVLSLARPQLLEAPIQKIVPTRDLLLLVDLSGSMEAQDFTNKAGAKVDRLTATKEVLGDFLSRREGDRVGLVVFGNAPFAQVPFTQDLDVSRLLLEELMPRMAGPRTAYGDAIGLGIILFEKSQVKQRVIIALTDGNDTGSRVPPAEAGRIAADNGIVIHNVAVGDPTTIGEEALDEEVLNNISRTTGGKYFHANDRQQLEGIYDELDRLEVREVETLSHRPKIDLFYWPLALALLASLGWYLPRALRGEAGVGIVNENEPDEREQAA